MLEASRKINKNPSLRLYLCRHFKLRAQLLLPRWPSGSLALSRGCLSLGLGVGTGICGLKFSELLQYLLFLKDVSLDLFDLSLLRFVFLGERQLKFLDKQVDKE